MEKEREKLHRGLVLKYFWQVIKNYKLAFFTVVIFTITTSALNVYIPLKFLNLWNVLSSNNFALVGQAKTIILFILLLGFIRWTLSRISSFTNTYFQANVMEGLRNQAFSYMIGHSHSFFSNNFSGSLAYRINKYARAFENLMDRLNNDGLPLVVRSVGTVIAIYTLVPKYALVLSIFCLIFLLTAFVYTRFKLKYDILAARSDTKTTGALADSISNHSSVELFAGYDYEKKRVGGVINEQKKATMKNWFLWEGLGSIQSLYSLSIEFIIFWMAINDWKVGLVAVPVMILLQGYLVRLIENLWSFSAIVRTFYDAFSDADEMAVILDTPYEIKDNIEKNIKDVKGEIVFKNVTYNYENKAKIFDNLSLCIKAGQKVAIVGSSGAGKSTFVNLLMRLFDVTYGTIFIDGVDISKISQKNLRDQIAFVPQDPALFHRTLLENIRYGRQEATDDEVKNAARLAHCDKFIEKLPKGYDTYVGERGIKLSGGERQRVAIARAILKNAPILILDEATSALDSESEMLIQDAFKNLIKDKTTIVIAHRLSTVKAMDRIIVIENGKIIEDDSHEELIKKDEGKYKKLWNLQAGGFSVN